MSTLKNILEQDSTLTQKITAEEFEQGKGISVDTGTEEDVSVAYDTYKRVLNSLENQG